MLVITGRETNVVNIGGEKVNPEKLEEILLDHPDVMQAAIIAMPNELGVNDICALLVPRAYLNVDSLREYCQARMPREMISVRFSAVSQLPIDEMGKLDRSKLPDLAKTKLN